MAKEQKQPKIGFKPHPTKTPRVQQPPPNFRGGVLAWRFNAVDKGGPFAWAKLSDALQHKLLIEKLAEFETMNEASLGSNGCHFIPTTSLCKEAQARLVEIELDDLDELYSMRVNGKVRVHCVHRPQYMRLLWYDPEHKVCPSPKKRT